MERAEIALTATVSRDDFSAKALNSCDNSCTKFFLAFPAGTLKEFFLQWTTSA